MGLIQKKLWLSLPPFVVDKQNPLNFFFQKVQVLVFQIKSVDVLLKP